MQAALVILTFIIALLLGAWLGGMIWEQTDQKLPRLAVRIGGAAVFGCVYIAFPFVVG